jgi:hypothetical protein
MTCADLGDGVFEIGVVLGFDASVASYALCDAGWTDPSDDLPSSFTVSGPVTEPVESSTSTWTANITGVTCQMGHGESFAGWNVGDWFWWDYDDDEAQPVVTTTTTTSTTTTTTPPDPDGQIVRPDNTTKQALGVLVFLASALFVLKAGRT